MRDLGSRAERRAGSTPVTRTTSEEACSVPLPRLRKAAKAPHPQSPSSFPNRRTHGGPPIWFRADEGIGPCGAGFTLYVLIVPVLPNETELFFLFYGYRLNAAEKQTALCRGRS